MWRSEARPVDAAAALVAPCDGVLLAVEDDVTSTSLVQVKGITYSIQSLLRVPPGAPVPPGCKRVALAIHLRVGDFHHVIAPTGFCCRGSVYVPGTLLPATWEGYHYLPGVLALNERLVVHGTVAAQRPTGARGSKTDRTPQEGAPFIGMALVGSTLSGNLKLCFDDRIRTNFLDPPDYAVHQTYSGDAFMRRGSRVGYFQWGSTVVVVADVPKEAQFVHHAAEVVKAGEPLLR
ncbi:phosphatidylserine decarboxylase [Strigomonas culicis]|uniref:Phosphatidylserine decarboxylase n=2 Tax=Strigomonas culicis TaxID=28005 RepID=S9VTG7_9TRYP|nr:phosphatidylserine decarboxylase [Strigomonas culicis]|eukprot:EPY26555.1 phosphatidylserine decarboxylase [Strigomonas culicis]